MEVCAEAGEGAVVSAEAGEVAAVSAEAGWVAAVEDWAGRMVKQVVDGIGEVW